MTNLQKGLVGHWTMDDADTSGGVLYDSSAYDNHGIINSGVTSGSSGIVGNSFLFDGTNSAFVGTDLFYETTNLTQVTVSAWYNSSTISGQIIASSDRNEYWRLGVGSDGVDGVQWTVASSDTVSPASQSSIQDGNWHHIVAVFDASLTNDHKIYIDGKLDLEENVFGGGVGSGSVSYTHIGTGSEGSSQNGATGPADMADGNIDDLRVYNRALSANEVRALYNMRSKRQQTSNLQKGLVGHWTMDNHDTSNSTLYDRSSYDNHANVGSGITTGSQSTIGESYQSDETITGNFVDVDNASDALSQMENNDGPEYTIAFWIYPISEDGEGDWPDIIDINSSGFRIEFGQDGVDEANLYQSKATDGNNYVVGADISSGSWYHLAYTMSTTGTTTDSICYNNGTVQQSTSEEDVENISNANSIDIFASGDLYTTRLSDVRFYDRALSKSEISRLYNKR